MLKVQTSVVPATVVRALKRNTRRVVLESSIAFRKRNTERPAPDFVIVGAQRCGTTSLFRALSSHSAIMPNVINAKGVHYFDTAFHQSPDWYFSHFPSLAEREAFSEKTGQQAVVGEASPYYLYHPAGAERMARVIPDTKLIVLLRDPVKRAISHHLHMVWEGHEPIKDLDAALDMEAERLQGLEQRLVEDPAFVSRPHQHFSYVARGHYASQLERLYTHFDRENVLVMATEELVRNSQPNLARIQSFIGLEPDPALDLQKRNASSKFEPRPETVERLAREFSDSNKRLSNLVECDIPWT